MYLDFAFALLRLVLIKVTLKYHLTKGFSLICNLEEENKLHHTFQQTWIYFNTLTAVYIHLDTHHCGLLV